jgi:AcrR family transcriptional regulator
MTRRYDSSRRKQAAELTRKKIVDAALRLHWHGITEFEPLAREAGCSLPSVRKHYPSKEALYRDCTRTFAESLTMPDLDALGRITEPARRLEEAVSELCRVHEAMFGYAWFGAHARKDSPTLETEMRAYEGLADAIAELVIQKDRSKLPVVRGLLDFLTYRALRLSGALAPEPARQELIATIRPLVAWDE